MFEFNFKGYLACANPYYYSSNHPIDVTVFAENESTALEKADAAVGYIHRETYRCVAKEIVDFDCKNEELYIKGASDFIKFIQRNSNKTSLCMFEIRTLLDSFIQQIDK